MPSATKELSELMNKWFGDDIGDSGPMDHLSEQGWSLSAGMYFKPGVEKVDDMEYKDLRCIEFLAQEWDYGWLPWSQAPEECKSW